MSRPFQKAPFPSDKSVGPEPARVILIRFVPAAEQKILRRFTQPRPMLATEQEVTFEVSAPDQSSAESFDEFYLYRVPSSLPAEMQKSAALWLASPGQPDAPKPVVIKLEAGTIRWRPGRAVLQCADAQYENILSGLVEFAFFEGELRRLEQSLLPYESAAAADVELAYQIRQNRRLQRERLGKTMENLARLRLTFAVLVPHLTIASRSLEVEGRRFATRLLARSYTSARLECFSNRLEACEDLYEGAVDRITDFGFYKKGLVLETIIVVLLVLELIAMSLSLFRQL